MWMLALLGLGALALAAKKKEEPKTLKKFLPVSEANWETQAELNAAKLFNQAVQLYAETSPPNAFNRDEARGQWLYLRPHLMQAINALPPFFDGQPRTLTLSRGLTDVRMALDSRLM